MKFLLDESAEFRIAEFLRQEGHDTTAIARDYPSALSDTQVLSIANEEQRVLITNDKDFGELIYRLNLPHSGIILFRLPAATAEIKITRLKTVLAEHADRLNSFLVVTSQRVRVRQSSTR